MRHPRYRILSFMGYPDYRVGRNGAVWSKKRFGKWIQLRLTPDKDGYLIVKLHKNNQQRTFRVGPLVLLTFVGPKPPKMWCCHNNGIRTDNRVTNLRWDTPQNNQLDKISHRTMRNGEQCNFSKLKADDVRQIRRLLDEGKMKQCEIAKMFNVSDGRITCIKKRKDWKHI
jgi:predicted XRE-type DNA-binding protein